MTVLSVCVREREQVCVRFCVYFCVKAVSATYDSDFRQSSFEVILTKPLHQNDECVCVVCVWVFV